MITKSNFRKFPTYESDMYVGRHGTHSQTLESLDDDGGHWLSMYVHAQGKWRGPQIMHIYSRKLLSFVMVKREEKFLSLLNNLLRIVIVCIWV
jgi:hypothetical protein